MADLERQRVTASEREGIMRINLALTFLLEYEDTLKKRAAAIPRGRWYLGVAKAMLTRWMKAVGDTIPLDQLRMMDRSIHETTYTIGVKCPARQGRAVEDVEDYGIVVSFKAMNAILVGCRDHCMMCGLDKIGQKKCELRKALDTIPNDESVKDESGCPYYGVM